MSLTMHPATESAPLCWRRSFPGGAEQARAVRRFVGCLLADCPYLDDVLLAADELVVNALRHTKSGQDGGFFVVEIARDGGRVAVSVADQGGPGEPAVLDAAELAESGRGLRTVSHTAASWGWYGNDQGRTVTAVFVGSWAA
ncbi:anti-sigma regulatory factor (Ser/Thr protein kinase) [Actinomadura pelletieri DSM 43383]|uniref:Anti-sigma regulatory factor (Ser/Thr protein kinase) n=1 Tax=Actinomadura pelletieri DSM 43383 TaxID=1120940 RepID=A0A495QBM7_9ACTN|nr:ATP-binding protein [Actinomadura pelletieri]RKS69083.1 anti-sigma regulatory factor (Ser/Thr protein kinase) [Actinomadura pelletieri DSM 43383]